MKNLLIKKSFKIALIVLTLVISLLYILMLVRPVSYGMYYVYKNSSENIEYTCKVKIKNDEIMRVININKEKGIVVDKEDSDRWIYRNGNTIYCIGTKKCHSVISDGTQWSEDEIKADNEYAITEEDYNNIVTSLNNAKNDGNQELFEEILENNDIDIFLDNVTICKAGDTTESFKCTGAIVLVIVGAIVLSSLVSLTILSIVYTKKTKYNN